jgi:hypothetical protein
MTTVIELNCETGEQIERPMTAEEIAQREADIEASAAQQAETEAEEQAKAAAKASALAKLEALGLTSEEIAAL